MENMIYNVEKYKKNGGGMAQGGRNLSKSNWCCLAFPIRNNCMKFRQNLFSQLMIIFEQQNTNRTRACQEGKAQLISKHNLFVNDYDGTTSFTVPKATSTVRELDLRLEQEAANSTEDYEVTATEEDKTLGLYGMSLPPLKGPIKKMLYKDP